MISDYQCSPASGLFQAGDLGTFLNGARVDRRKFDHEDEIRIGDTVLRVSVHEGTVPVSE